MKIKIKTKFGICYASIKSEQDIQKMQSDLKKCSWMDQRQCWIRAIADPTRFKMAYLLSLQPLCVCDMANVLEVSSSAISQHLRKLKDMHLVSSHRKNQTLFYSISDKDFANFLSKVTPKETN